MSCVEKYFKYSMRCGCGITKIHMQGVREDWVKIIENTKKLRKYGDIY